MCPRSVALLDGKDAGSEIGTAETFDPLTTLGSIDVGPPLRLPETPLGGGPANVPSAGTSKPIKLMVFA